MTQKTTPARTLEGLPHLEEWEEAMTNIQYREAEQVFRTLRRVRGPLGDYVAPEMSICYDRKDLRRAVRPDVLVASGVPDRVRKGYLPWKETKAPDWVLEVASESTAEVDREEKPKIYQALGIREVVLFDPEGAYHPEVLTLERLADDGYRAVSPGPGGRLASEVLGLEMMAVGYWEDKVHYWQLRFYAPGDANPIPTDDELLAETGARIAARDSRIAALEEELRRLRGGA